MLSPKGSSKHSLVTYNSDISDDEHHNEEPHDVNPDISDLMSISPTSMDSSIGNSIEPSPKVEKNIDEVPVKKFKKPVSSNSLRGLVSYGMDEDDSMGEDDAEDEMEEYSLSMEKDASLNIEDNTQNNTTLDNEELFNNESRESDNEVESKGVNDLKCHSGQSSSNVKAAVVTERPKGNDLPYLLSRRIFNNPDDISLPAPVTTKPSPELEAKIADLRAKALNSRCNPTEAILKNKAYRNPSIYEKLIQHMKIDERGTNYPPELYDPYRFGEESYYEVLAKNQDSAERKRLEHEAAGAGGTAASSSSITTSTSKTGKVGTSTSLGGTRTDPKARKTKWDSSTKPQMVTKSQSAITTSSTSAVTIETKTMYPLHK